MNETDTAQALDPADRADAIDYLARDGNFRVPCSRYGTDSHECAAVAYAAAMEYATATGEPVSLDSLDYIMGLVVNDHDDVAHLLSEECPDCREYLTHFDGSAPSGEFNNWRCDNCGAHFKVFPDIGEE